MWFKARFTADSVNNEAETDEHPNIPERHYLEDPDFMKENFEEEVQEMHNTDSVSESTQLCTQSSCISKCIRNRIIYMFKHGVPIIHS